MINSHPQLVLLSTFASNMTNRIMVDFIQKYLEFDPTLRKKSRYPTVVSLLQLLIHHVWHCGAKLWGKRTPGSLSMAYWAHYDHFSGGWSNSFESPSIVTASQWNVFHKKHEGFSLNHKRQELILTNWTWKPPPRLGGQPTCCLLCVLVGERKKISFCIFLA